ncbi:uncharacterized protein LOC129306832 [Prosopis cineraria]|uniref:uncharacterized protein LOC129306832 n=1 Tax=Prosopis cineraria TaxID=364024 RepID=UPI00241059AD|nr:uncharacterized protein LOC129306832 [Prosopis cineraria]
MNSVWRSNWMNQGEEGVPMNMMRATYMNLYKWPESDAEFIRCVSSNKRTGNAAMVDSISCRQMFLRSYRFSRKQSIVEKTHSCFQRVKRSLCYVMKKKKKKQRKIRFRRRKCLVWRKLKAISFFTLLRRLLSCSALLH